MDAPLVAMLAVCVALALFALALGIGTWLVRRFALVGDALPEGPHFEPPALPVLSAQGASARAAWRRRLWTVGQAARETMRFAMSCRDDAARAEGHPPAAAVAEHAATALLAAQTAEREMRAAFAAAIGHEPVLLLAETTVAAHRATAAAAAAASAALTAELPDPAASRRKWLLIVMAIAIVLYAMLFFAW
ncbi:hypothetical protein LBMAG53_01490 [Planctomycetota bacterium]|nr:hypothetical protein LBMAG53_01490 [Planctomycetota bacterium]